MKSFKFNLYRKSAILLIVSVVCSNLNERVWGLKFMSPVQSTLSSKKIFLNELTEARSGNPILSNKDPKNLEILLKNMVKDNPTSEPSSQSSLLKFSKGNWDVIYAPHIKTLGKVLFTEFSVFYKFLDVDGGKVLGIISNVRYDSKIFGKGWLNTQGKVDSVSGTVCRVKWDNIWWNVASDDNDTPALLSDVSRHILPNLIQRIGTKGFIEDFSKFPVSYLDEDTCVFEFSTLGTRICAARTS